MKKRTLILVLSVAVIAAGAIGATIAYFSDQTEPANNVFTVGNVGITLTEPAWLASGGGYENSTNVYPGEKLAKDPTVTNTGDNPCMVRIKVDKSADWITLEGLDTANWKANGDYYYYLKPLASGDNTTALFQGIGIPTDVTNADSGNYDVKVIAQAVQSEGISDTTDLTKVIAMFDNAFPPTP